MSPGQTYYDVFALDQRATAQQVRTAYLRLMKVHHPDKSEGQQAPGFVALINLSYETLSDPVKRAAYDADLRHRNIVAIAASSPPIASSKKRFLPPRLATVMLACAGFAGIGLMVTLSQSDNLLETLFTASWEQNTAVEPAGLPRLTKRDAIRRQARLAKTLSPSEALIFSERCFRQAKADASGRALQLCIIFDDAFIYWRQTPQWNAMMPPYFNDGVVHTRHANSLLRFEVNTEGTLAHLRYEAFRALLDDVDNAEVPLGEPT